MSRFKIKTEVAPQNVESKLKYLVTNIAKLKNQRFVDAVVNMNGMYNRNKKLSEHQEKYLDYLIEEANREPRRDDTLFKGL